MPQLDFLLTFDYELPLGGASDFRKALFDPAERLIGVADEIEVAIVLFADICSAIRFRDWDEEYYESFADQLNRALSTRHDVQLHIHPHWMTSEYVDGEFRPSPDFSLSSFAQRTGVLAIESIIETAFNELGEICRGQKKEYLCCAYRAGGYDVGPESARILGKLNELGIRFDSSVVPGLYHDLGFSRVDYRRAPELPYWELSKDGPLTEPGGSDLYELPIATRPATAIDIVRRRIGKIRNFKAYQKRRYVNSGWGYAREHQRLGLVDTIRSLFSPIVLNLDREYADVQYHMKTVDYMVHKYSREGDLLITAIGHPKSMGDYHLGVMRDLVDAIRKRYPESGFTTFSQLYHDWSTR